MNEVILTCSILWVGKLFPCPLGSYNWSSSWSGIRQINKRKSSFNMYKRGIYINMKTPKTVRQNEVYVPLGLRSSRYGSGTPKGSWWCIGGWKDLIFTKQMFVGPSSNRGSQRRFWSHRPYPVPPCLPHLLHFILWSSMVIVPFLEQTFYLKFFRQFWGRTKVIPESFVY